MWALRAAVVKRVLILAAGVVVVAGIARAVTSAREQADLLRAPDDVAIDSLAGVTSPRDSDAQPLRRFPVADSMFGHSGRVRFRTLTRTSAIALPEFIEQY